MERVDDLRHLDDLITEALTWMLCCDSVRKAEHQCMFADWMVVTVGVQLLM